MATSEDGAGRVAVTGIGVVSPVGCGRADFWSAIVEGRCGIGPVQAFDTSEFPVHIGAEVRGFDADAFIHRLSGHEVGRAAKLAIAAAAMAIEDAGLEPSLVAGRLTGVSMGTTSGEPLYVERFNDIRRSEGVESVPPEVYCGYPCHTIAANLALEFGCQGPCRILPTACAAGNYAIGQAFDWIRAGRVELALAGGADAFSRIPYLGFARLGAIASDKCSPFDKNRQGMVPGEGAGILVLEPLERARRRGARIYAEILGYGLSCDAHHMTGAHPEGDGAVRAMTAAVRESGLSPSQIDYVCAHGTGTPSNDRTEAAAHGAFFGTRSREIPISSIKSMIGHTMGAASAIEAAACALALRTGCLPPTIHFETPDPECDVDCVPNAARKADPRIVLNNAYAFGGNNASLCLAQCLS